MTLILTRASIDYILQVGDRLVTRANTPYDELANKQIVYRARDGIVCMGYTGIAFLGDVPTDQWIVEKLTGMVFDRDSKPPALTCCTLSPWLDMGRSLRRIKTALDTALPTELPEHASDQWTKSPFSLCVDGWQWKAKGRYRPVLALLNKPRDTSTFQLTYKPRNWYVPRGMFLVGAAPKATVTVPHMEQLTAQICGKAAEEAEGLLVEAIRQVATLRPQVGMHCMSILLPPPTVGWVRVRYIPDVPSEAVLVAGTSSRQLTVGFSPWLVGPSIIAAPSVMSASKARVPLGPHTVHLETAGGDGMPFIAGQPRARPPWSSSE